MPDTKTDAKTRVAASAALPVAADDELSGLISRYGFSTEGKKEIARALGISLATLYRRLKKMNDSGVRL